MKTLVFCVVLLSISSGLFAMSKKDVEKAMKKSFKTVEVEMGVDGEFIAVLDGQLYAGGIGESRDRQIGIITGHLAVRSALVKQHHASNLRMVPITKRFAREKDGLYIYISLIKR